MKTVFTFTSDRFRPTAAELDDTHADYINPDVFGRELADYLETGLKQQGYSMRFRCPEDWGFWQEIAHDRGYTLAIGCANVENRDGWVQHRVFVTPDKPSIRPLKQLFRKIDVEEDVDRLVATIRSLLAADPRTRDLDLQEP